MFVTYDDCGEPVVNVEVAERGLDRPDSDTAINEHRRVTGVEKKAVAAAARAQRDESHHAPGGGAKIARPTRTIVAPSSTATS